MREVFVVDIGEHDPAQPWAEEQLRALSITSESFLDEIAAVRLPDGTVIPATEPAYPMTPTPTPRGS